MRLHWLLFAGFAALASAAACGGTVQNGDVVTGGGSGAPGSGDAGGGGSGGESGFPSGGATSVPDGGGLPDARYTDPGCAPANKVAGSHDCDVFASFDECGPGARCVPYVRYADQCQTEEIGTECASAGPGRQGDDCSVDDCASGFVCVTAGSGFKCAALCRLVPNGDTCTSGLICAPLDVDGFFVCG